MYKIIVTTLLVINCVVSGHESMESQVIPAMLKSSTRQICDYTLNYVICPSVGHFSLNLVGVNVEYMSIQNNNIEELPSWLMKQFQKLKVLDLHDNKIKSLPLSGNPELTFLQADHNMLGTDRRYRGSLKNMFKKNTKLGVASLRNNGITRLSCSFANKVDNQLTQLNLADNRLKTIGSKTFSYLRNLKRLYIHQNNITFVHMNAFKQNPELTNLDLCDNAIGFMGSNDHLDLTNNRKLLALYMSNNKLSSLTELNVVECTALEHLDVSYNRISSIGPYDIFRNNQLLHLNLSYNQIQTIDSLAFTYLANLQVLDLSGNRLTTLPVNLFRNLKNLQALSLAHNSLESLSEYQFLGNGRLTALDLSGNLLHIWEPATISSNINLRYLDLRDNLFKVETMGYFTKNRNSEFDVRVWASDSHDGAEESLSVRALHDGLNKVVFARLSCLRLGGNPMAVQAFKASQNSGVRFMAGSTNCVLSQDGSEISWNCGCTPKELKSTTNDWIENESELHLY